MQAQLPEVLFFTCATGFYENFVTPYVFFAELHNPGSRYEFVIGDTKHFQTQNSATLHWLKENLGIEILLRERSSIALRPRMDHSLRFIAEPIEKAQYVYIGDVDVMLLENIMTWHRPVFDAGLPYSNVVRTNSRKLTGLHLANYAKHYPLGAIDDLVLGIENDEELLYAIVERKGLLYDGNMHSKVLAERTIADQGYVPFRPVHGIHMSLNRLPISYDGARPGWGISWVYANRCDTICQSEQFEAFFATLPHGPREVVANLSCLARGICAIGETHFKRIAM